MQLCKLEEKRMALHAHIASLAFGQYLRHGQIDPMLTRLLNATSSKEALLKYNPDQPRVPAGHPDGGQWTSVDGGLITLPDVTDEDYSNAIKPLLTVEAIVSLLPAGRILRAWRSFSQITASNTWTFGNHKSEKRWANQMARRDWTPEQIKETLATGKKFPAPNNVKPANKATRYENLRTGKYLVKDNKTGEILQLGGKDFDRPPLK